METYREHNARIADAILKAERSANKVIEALRASGSFDEITSAELNGNIHRVRAWAD